MTTVTIPSEKELAFALFCIDFVAKALEKPPDEVYQALKDSGLLQDYLIENYDILHTQGKDYVVNDIIELMREKGLL